MDAGNLDCTGCGFWAQYPDYRGILKLCYKSGFLGQYPDYAGTPDYPGNIRILEEIRNIGAMSELWYIGFP
jgi:hypothetical protein